MGTNNRNVASDISNSYKYREGESQPNERLKSEEEWEPPRDTFEQNKLLASKVKQNGTCVFMRAPSLSLTTSNITNTAWVDNYNGRR